MIDRAWQQGARRLEHPASDGDGAIAAGIELVYGGEVLHQRSRMERHNRELRRREKLGTVWTERNLLALLQKQGLKTNHLKRNATPAGKLGVPEPAPAAATGGGETLEGMDEDRKRLRCDYWRRNTIRCGCALIAHWLQSRAFPGKSDLLDTRSAAPYHGSHPPLDLSCGSPFAMTRRPRQLNE